MSNIILKVEGLDCAHCAQKLGNKICKIKNVKNADISIITNKLNIQYENIGEIELVCQVREKAETMGVDIVENVNPPQRAFGGLDKGLKIRLARYFIGGIMYIIALLATNFGAIDLSDVFAHEMWGGRSWSLANWLFIISYIIFGADILIRAVQGIIKRDIFNENFHMSIATIGAIVIGLYYEAVLVMIFFQVGEFFQDMAVNRSRKSISDLMNIKAEYANVVIDGEIIQVEPQEVNIGDIILVKPGEKVPLDGVVIEGSSQVDASSLIGESVPRSARVNDEVLSGVINLTSLLKIQVTKDYSNSTVAKIMNMVENAAAKKSQTERFITQFARIYTPIVTIAALLLMFVPMILFPGTEPNEWVLRGIIFLMVSCPCALHLSVPLSFFSSIGSSSKKGVLMKGSTFVQNLSEIGIVVFDKTGTITKGVFNVVKVVAEGKVTEEQLLSVAASVEIFSNHPIAKSIIAECEKKDIEIHKTEAENFEEIHGKGLKGTVESKVILAGNAKLMEQNGIEYKEYIGSGSVVHIAKDGDYLGHIVISDIIKSDSAIGIRQLKAAGIKKTVMLSGDREETAKAVASEVGIDEVYAQLLPDEKVEMVEQLYKKYPGEKIAFVGDGINDAPVLSRVDVGIAMGGIGSDAAVEAADVVIMTDEISKLSAAVGVSKNTMKIVRQNIVFVMIVKFGVLALAVFGMADILWAVFADSGVALLAVLNSIRKK